MGDSQNGSLAAENEDIERCWWCGTDPLYIRYHDSEWGFPVDDDGRLFEKICLEGFQAGLSWLTILKKREAFREAFHNFDFARVASFQKRTVEKLVTNASIVRHRGKIESTINNARRARELADEYGSLAAYFWSFEPAHPVEITSQDAVRATTPESIALSRDLKKRGWTFVGPTTCYAFMQAMGMVNDHLISCARFKVAQRARRQFRRPQ